MSRDIKVTNVMRRCVINVKQNGQVQKRLAITIILPVPMANLKHKQWKHVRIAKLLDMFVRIVVDLFVAHVEPLGYLVSIQITIISTSVQLPLHHHHLWASVAIHMPRQEGELT